MCFRSASCYFTLEWAKGPVFQKTRNFSGFSISGSEFFESLFSPGKFSGLSRNGLLMFLGYAGRTLLKIWQLRFCKGSSTRLKTREAYFQEWNCVFDHFHKFSARKSIVLLNKTDTREQGLGGGSILDQGITKWKKPFQLLELTTYYLFIAASQLCQICLASSFLSNVLLFFTLRDFNITVTLLNLRIRRSLLRLFCEIINDEN